MMRKDKVALARVVLSNQQRVIAPKPLGKGLLGTTLRYPYELRDENDYFDGIPSPRISKDMIDLAAHILDTKASKLDPHKFKDKYETALKALVKRKAAGKTIAVPEEKAEESNVIDLMDALKQSRGRKKGSPSNSRRKKRGSAHRGRKRKNRLLEAMEARSVEAIPTGEMWQYEPKWDGFRCLLARDGQAVVMYSKSGQNLNGPAIFR
jgi:non-homologous end joining protein Ku